MKEESQTRLAILVFDLILTMIVVGLYLGGERRETKSERVKKKVEKVENTYREDNSYRRNQERVLREKNQRIVLNYV